MVLFLFLARMVYNIVMKYLAVLGRLTKISLAEVEAIFGNAKKVGQTAVFESDEKPEIDRFGGVMKFAEYLEESPLEFLKKVPDGKITIGVSDYSKNATRKTASMEALKLKKILVRHGRSVRVVENKEAVLSTATSLHNGLSGGNARKIEFAKLGNEWYRVIGVQNIDAYARRDQARPARDAFVGMLPPKLAQILINLCGELPMGATVLDPFCGTGVVLQEALLMGYEAYGTDLSERMVEYSEKNLKWLSAAIKEDSMGRDRLSVGDATSFKWEKPSDAVACEGYLGQPMSMVPTEIKLKAEKQNCETIIVGFLKNLSAQLASGTPVVVAAPAWLKRDGGYERLKILSEKRVDVFDEMGYNVDNRTCEGLLYSREGQIVARDIIILRKK